MSRISHQALKYLLVVPLILAVCLGIFTDGAIRFTQAQAKEQMLFGVRLQIISLQELADMDI